METFEFENGNFSNVKHFLPSSANENTKNSKGWPFSVIFSQKNEKNPVELLLEEMKPVVVGNSDWGNGELSALIAQFDSFVLIGL